MAWELRSYKEEIVFARLDNNWNEIPLVMLNEPTIYLFSKDSKKVASHFEGKLNRSEFIHFIREKSSLG